MAKMIFVTSTADPAGKILINIDKIVKIIPSTSNQEEKSIIYLDMVKYNRVYVLETLEALQKAING